MRPARPARLAAALAAVLAATVPACAGAQDAPAPSAGSAVAFVDVTVIPMDGSGDVLENRTVVVEGGRIAAVGPAASTPVPEGALRVDGRGRWLIPGLSEMHAHIPGPNAPERLIEDILFLYVANGITTIRGMLGAPNHLTLRERTASGELLGPTILAGAPSLNGNSAPTPDSAAKLVRAHAAAGYDFLKLHPGLRRDVFDAIVATAGEVGITFAGHVSEDVGLEHALASGQSTVDHLDGYLQAVVSDEVQARLKAGGAVPPGELARSVDQAKLRAIAARTREVGTWNVPTMVLWENFGSMEEPEATLARLDGKQYVPPEMREGWLRQKRNMMRANRENGVTAEDARAVAEARRGILKALYDAGAGLLLGTDSPQVFSVPGFSLHPEVALWAEVGIRPIDILAAGSRNVAEYVAVDLRGDGAFGTVAPGNRADLVLLEGNPLEDIGNLARRAGVMVRGRWVPESEIRAGLAELAARHGGE